MLIAAYDTATVTGWALGPAGLTPRSGSVRLKTPSEPRDVAPWNMMCFLRDQWVLDKPDLVVIEQFMNPAAQKSADAVILQIMVFGVVIALCQDYGVRYVTPHRMTVVKHFLGKQSRQNRASLKAKVITQAQLLGYMPRNIRDDNRADACALFDWAAATHAGVIPKKLFMVGEQPRDGEP